MAAFVSDEVTTDFAKVLAVSLVFAPSTTTSKSAVAPSPSPAIIFERAVVTKFRLLLNTLYSSLLSLTIFSLSASPFASIIRESFVDVSPSTLTILKVSTTSSLRAFNKSSFEIFTSVVINPSIVHIFGCIIPEPLHIAPILTIFPDISNSTATSFETVSVVIIALAASFAAFSLCSKEFESDSIPVQIFSIGSCIPITPVDAKSIEFSSAPSSDAAFFALCLQYSIPSSLVQALAIPEFITIAFT